MIKLGFMTNVLVKYGMTDFEQVTRWAKENGFACMEAARRSLWIRACLKVCCLLTTCASLR